MWKKLSSKEIFSHPRLTLIEDEVELPNGKVTKYLKFKTEDNAATLICKREDSKILLQKEYSYPPDKNLYQFPGGAVPLEEDISKGANRELQEEADLKANKLTLLGDYYINNRRSDSMMSVFLAENLVESSLPGDEEEEIESFWFSEKEIDELIKKQEIKNYSLLTAWAIYKTFKK